MITGIHGLFYSSEPEALRAFLRDKLKLPSSDVGGGWLIFDFREGDLGVHPTDASDGDLSGTHNLSFFTDDIAGTVGELGGRGVVFDHPVEDRGYGLVTHFTMPGGVRVQLYQPAYAKATHVKAVRATPAKRAKAAKKAKPAKSAKAAKKAKPAKKAKRGPAKVRGRKSR